MDGNWLLPPKGSTTAKLMLILSHPNHEDLQVKQIMTGAYEIEIRNAVAAAGIDMVKDVYVTSMVKSGIGSKPKPTSEQIAAHAAILDYEIDLVKPKLIMTLGAEVFKRIMKTNGTQGDSLGEIIDSPYGKLLPNFSPGMILNQDPKKRIYFRDAFELAGRFINDRLDYTQFEWIVVDDPAVNTEIVKHYIDSGKLTVGYDAEWFGSKMTDDEVMYTFQYSCEPHKAIILDISKDGLTENRALLDTMKPLLEHSKADRLGWNIRADDKRLLLRGFNLSVDTLGFDGMKACAFFDSRYSKGLETGIKKYTNYPPYYNELNKIKAEHKFSGAEIAKLKFTNPDVFWRYCAGDAVSHYTACVNMRQQMKKHLDPRVTKYYFETYLPLSDYFADLELHGIPIDVEVMEDITTKYTNKYNELYARLMELTSPLLPEFNPASAPQKKELLYNVLKLQPAYYTKSGKSPKSRAWYDKQKPHIKTQYSPSTNGKSLSTMKFELSELVESGTDDPGIPISLEIVSTLLNLNRVGVFAKKFLNKQGITPHDWETMEEDDEDEPLKSSYWAALCSDGRIHADFFECLNNFRSSSKVNVQNPASKVLSNIPEIFVPGYTKMSKDQQKESNILIPRNLRHIFYPGKPDYCWAEVDVAGADLAIAAFLSKDPDYIQDILMGGFHLTKAKEYFRDPTISKENYSRYVSAKAITFRVAYTAELKAAAMPIQAEIFAESGILIPIGDIEYALKTWERYTKYMDYRANCKAMVDNYAYIENARGFRYFFEDTENKGIKSGWLNESLAYPIASELALFIWDVSVSVKRQLVKDGVWNKYVYPVNSIHDANIYSVHKDLMKDNYFPEICKSYFTDKCKIATGDNLGMEMVVGDRWKPDKDQIIFSNETKWDFERKCWKWKH